MTVKSKESFDRIIKAINAEFKDKPSELRQEVMAELGVEVEKFKEDTENFFMGGGMS